MNRDLAIKIFACAMTPEEAEEIYRLLKSGAERYWFADLHLSVAYEDRKTELRGVSSESVEAGLQESSRDVQAPAFNRVSGADLRPDNASGPGQGGTRAPEADDPDPSRSLGPA